MSYVKLQENENLPMPMKNISLL